MIAQLLIGAYTERLPHVDGHAGGLLSASFDGAAVTEVRVAATLVNPSWVTASADGSHVYAVEETGPDGSVVAFGRDAAGVLTELGRVSSGGDSPAHVAVHPTGRFLLTGTYGSGTVSVYALRADGSIGERTAFVQHEGHGPDPARQAVPHVHQLSADPATGDVVVVDLGLGEVRWYALSDDGMLTLRPEATIAIGAPGPRHLAFHPDGRHALLVNELDSTIEVLRRVGGGGEGVEAGSGEVGSSEVGGEAAGGDEASGRGDRFVRVSRASTRPAGASGASFPAAVRVTSEGRTVLVTNRGDDTIAVFAFDADVSALALAAVVPAGGRFPRDLIVSPEGDRVLVACQNSDELAVHAFDPSARTLRLLGSSPVPTPVCVLFV